MEQNTISKITKKSTKNDDLKAIRFDKAVIKQLDKFVDKANKKQFGQKIRASHILTNLLSLADEILLEKVIKLSQDNSLTHRDKKEMFLKENISKFGGNSEKFEAKMMELMGGYLSQTSS